MITNLDSFVAKEAIDLVTGERHNSYGHPRDDFSSLARMWSTWLNHRHGICVVLDARDVAMMMILNKINREANKHKRDNLVDIVGYAICADNLGVKE